MGLKYPDTTGTGGYRAAVVWVAGTGLLLLPLLLVPVLAGAGSGRGGDLRIVMVGGTVVVFEVAPSFFSVVVIVIVVSSSFFPVVVRDVLVVSFSSVVASAAAVFFGSIVFLCGNRFVLFVVASLLDASEEEASDASAARAAEARAPNGSFIISLGLMYMTSRSDGAISVCFCVSWWVFLLVVLSTILTFLFGVEHVVAFIVESISAYETPGTFPIR